MSQLTAEDVSTLTTPPVPTVTLPASDVERDLRRLFAEYDATVLETLADEPMLEGIEIWYAEVEGRHTFIFPRGQNSAVRLKVARRTLALAGCAV